MKVTTMIIMCCLLIASMMVFSIIIVNNADENFKKFSQEYIKEYQIELDFDTVRVYQYGRYVDCYIIEDNKLNQLDEILAIDNR